MQFSITIDQPIPFFKRNHDYDISPFYNHNVRIILRALELLPFVNYGRFDGQVVTSCIGSALRLHNYWSPYRHNRIGRLFLTIPVLLSPLFFHPLGKSPLLKKFVILHGVTHDLYQYFEGNEWLFDAPIIDKFADACEKISNICYIAMLLSNNSLTFTGLALTSHMLVTAIRYIGELTDRNPHNKGQFIKALVHALVLCNLYMQQKSWTLKKPLA